MDPVHLGQRVTRLARSRVTRRAALATGGAGHGHDAARSTGRGARASAGAGRHARRGDRGRQSAAGCPGLDANAGRSRVRLWGACPRRGGGGALVAPPRTSASLPWPTCRGRSRPMPSSMRCTTAASPPLTRAEHRLLVHGLVEHPTLFTMDDLKRFPSVSVVHFLECSGNSFFQWQEDIEGRDGAADRTA